MFELRLTETNTVVKAGNLALCQAIQARNQIQNCSYILPIAATKKSNKVKFASVLFVALAILVLI